MIKAVIYARYSSDNQDDATIETQLRECHEKAKSLNAAVIREYFDIAQSGRNDSREQFRQMLADAKLKAFNLVIVRKFDRFARNVLDARLTEQLLEKYGIKLVSVHESFDDSTTAGWFSKQMVHLVNEWYSRNLAVETISGMETNTRKGFRCGGTAPFGYRNIKVLDGSTGKTRTKLDICPKESPAVKLVFKMFSEGESLGKIIEQLEKQNLKPRKAKKFSKSAISQMLRNETYTGTLIWRKGKDPKEWIRKENAFKALIGPITWEKCRKRLDDAPKSIRARGSAHPLTGRVFCELCGKTFVIKGKPRGRWRLSCSGHLKKECKNNRSIYEDVLIAKAKKVLINETFNEEEIYNALHQMGKEMTSGNERDLTEIKKLETELEQIEEKQITLVEEFATGNLPKHIVKKTMDKVEEERKGIFNRLTYLKEEVEKKNKLQVTSKDVGFFGAIAKSVIENSEGLALKNAFNAFDVKITLSKNSAKIKVTLPISESVTDTLSAGDGT